VLKALLVFVVVAGAVLGIGYLYLQAKEQRAPKRVTRSSRTGTRSAPTRKPTKSKFDSGPRLLRVLPVALLAAAVVCLIVALAQFRISRTGVVGTVVLTIDASQSMNQKDVSPSRLGAAQEAARTFLEQIPATFPVGLVTFADDARQLEAPTQDRAAVAASMDSPPRGAGTVIGDGLNTSLDAIEAVWHGNPQPAAVILLSDGRDTGSTVSPQDAASRAASLGVPVYTVVLGKTSTGGGPGANAALLEDIAQRTGAQSFTAETAGELDQVYGALGTQLSTQLKVSNSAALFVAIAAFLAVAAGLSVLLLPSRSDL
jgi:Ca-activated chloride channel family protein